jgi:GTP:adenosylcobinamide-phosphate guanylyltransferase
VTQAAGLTAVVLAGTRPGGDPLAEYAGVSHKALIDVGGVPMLARVLAALDAAPAVARMVVVIDRPEVMAALPKFNKPVELMAAQSGPSASVAAAMSQLGTPLLVTTADHAMLRPEWIGEFLRAGAGSGADAVLALARREAVLAAAPHTRRTWLRFADGDYSGCNLFLLRNAAALGVVQLWQQMEAARKRPLSLLRRLGLAYVLRYKLGWLTLAAALARLGRLSGTRIVAVTLADGRAAIDVDKPADLDLVRQIVGRESAA